MEFSKIYNENCLDTMSRMSEGSIDLLITSPPYDNLRKYKGYSFDFESIAKEIFRIIKLVGVVVWIVGDATLNGSESGTGFKQALYFKELGFNLHDTMIYEKINYIPLTHKRYEQAFEYMFVFSKGKIKTFNPMMVQSKGAGNTVSRVKKVNEQGMRDTTSTIKSKKIKKNIWAYSIGSNNDKTTHPAPFPLQLAVDHINSWSNVGDVVYDPMAGSGTVAKAAILTGRECVLSEMCEEYCLEIEKRIKI